MIFEDFFASSFSAQNKTDPHISYPQPNYSAISLSEKCNKKHFDSYLLLGAWVRENSCISHIARLQPSGL